MAAAQSDSEQYQIYGILRVFYSLTLRKAPMRIEAPRQSTCDLRITRELLRPCHHLHRTRPESRIICENPYAVSPSPCLTWRLENPGSVL